MHIIDTILKIQKKRKKSIPITDMIVTNGKKKMQEGQSTFHFRKRTKVRAGKEGKEKGELSNSTNKPMNRS